MIVTSPSPARTPVEKTLPAGPELEPNYGQLRRNTDRRARHRHAALCLATAILIAARLINWRNRWRPA